MTYTTKALSIDLRVRTFWFLVALCGLSSILYVYAVMSTVSNTVARKNLEARVVTLGARIGEMEFAYIGEKNKVSMQAALERGYKEVTAPIYVSRTNTRPLSVNLNR